KLWIGTSNGLVRYDPESKKQEWFQTNSRDSTTISGKIIQGIVQDGRGRYWISVVAGGLDAFDPLTKKFHTLNMRNSSLRTNFLDFMKEFSNKIIYIGSNSGLIAFNPDSETFRMFSHRKDDPQSISSDRVSDFIETSSGIIWVGT